MSVLHLYISSGRFLSEEELDDYLQPVYDENGERIDSDFMKEVGLTSFSPSSIEAIYESEEKTIAELLEGSSYEEQWLAHVPKKHVGNVALVIFEPNVLLNPEFCSLHYLGHYKYEG